MKEYFDVPKDDQRRKEEAFKKAHERVNGDENIKNLILYAEDKDSTIRIVNIIDNFVFKNQKQFSQDFLALLAELKTKYFEKIEIQKLKSEYVNIKLLKYDTNKYPGFTTVSETRIFQPDYVQEYKSKKDEYKEFADKIMKNEANINEKIIEKISEIKEKFPEEFDILAEIVIKTHNSYN